MHKESYQIKWLEELRDTVQECLVFLRNLAEDYIQAVNIGELDGLKSSLSEFGELFWYKLDEFLAGEITEGTMLLVLLSEMAESDWEDDGEDENKEVQ